MSGCQSSPASITRDFEVELAGTFKFLFSEPLYRRRGLFGIDGRIGRGSLALWEVSPRSSSFGGDVTELSGFMTVARRCVRAPHQCIHHLGC